MDKKEAIKSKLTASRQATYAALGDVSLVDWDAQAYSEGSEWKVIDILRHVTDSERGMTGLMVQIKGGGEGVPSDFDLARWNQRVVSKLGDKGPQELLAAMVENRAALFAFIDSLEDADWDRTGRHASLRIMSIEEVCHLIADHEQQHVAGIQEAIRH